MLPGEIKPSKAIWEYYDGKITLEQIVCHVFDKAGGWHISRSANYLLEDLGFLTPKGRVNKDGLRIASALNHERYFRKKYDIPLVNPFTGEKSFI